jgi:hypothetical protein
MRDDKKLVWPLEEGGLNACFGLFGYFLMDGRQSGTLGGKKLSTY